MQKTIRFFSIFQLCIVFSAVFMACSHPFLRDLFSQRKETLLYQFILGHGELISRIHRSDPLRLEQIHRNTIRFLQLPDETRSKIEEGYANLHTHNDKSFFYKLSASATSLLFELPPLYRAWLLLAAIGAIFALLSSADTWGVALLTLALAAGMVADSYRFSPQAASPVNIFPTEKYLLSHYSSQEPPTTIKDEIKILQDSWEFYLIYEWLGEEPSHDPSKRLLQKEEGEYRFHVSRLEQSIDHPPLRTTAKSNSLLGAALCLLWSLAYAAIVTAERFNRKENSSAYPLHSPQ